MSEKPLASFATFSALDLRVGKIIAVEEARTRKPTYRMTVDLGPALGHKVSCGAYRNYSRDYLLGKHVICVVNLGEKKMGPEVSQVLVLGVDDREGGIIFLTTDRPAEPGAEVF